jgi:hypothetical protein
MLFVGCKNSNLVFDTYKQKFKGNKLPLVVRGCYLSDISVIALDPARDSPFVTYNTLGYCSIPTNGKYFAIVTLAAADCYIPVLSTYDEEGNKIDEQDIHIGGCGGDCGFTCEEYMVINADYTIYTSDTISQYECDSLGNETPGTREHFVVYKTGRLLSNGKIELSGEMKKYLKD